MGNPLVSILTPSYNQVSWLRDNLQSVQTQTYGNIEHIIMDGGSNDGSVEVLQSSAAPIIWRSEPDRGQSHALNMAFEKSTGDIIGWLNSDDAFADRHAVEAAVKVFDEYPGVGVVYGDSLVVNADNEVLLYNRAPEFSKSLFQTINFFVQPAAFFRRSIILAPLVNESLHYVMDRDLWLRLSDMTEFKRVDAVVGIDRQQPERKTNDDRYPAENRAYMLARGVDTSSRKRKIQAKVAKVALRWSGTLRAEHLARDLDPAIDLVLPSKSAALLSQVAVPRNRMKIN